MHTYTWDLVACRPEYNKRLFPTLYNSIAHSILLPLDNKVKAAVVVSHDYPLVVLSSIRLFGNKALAAREREGGPRST